MIAAAIEKSGMQVDYRDPTETQKLLDAEGANVSRVIERLGIGKQ